MILKKLNTSNESNNNIGKIKIDKLLVPISNQKIINKKYL